MRSVLRRYMPNKPHKFGFKVFSRNGTSGMLYDFELEGAPDPARKEQVEELGYCGADIVMRLCSGLLKPYIDQLRTPSFPIGLVKTNLALLLDQLRLA